jgi:ribosome-associated translation inhibitor RaiA
MNSEMNIEIQALNFSLTQVQSRYVERRIDFALAANGEDIESVEVWLSDIRIAEGAVLKRCLVHVALKGNSTVVIDSTDLDLRVAIHRAADQVSWKVSRSVGRQKRAIDQFLPSAQFRPQEQFQPSGLWNNRTPVTDCSQSSI